MPFARRRLIHEHRVMLMALLAGLPGSVTAMILLWTGNQPPKVLWTVGVLIGAFWFGCTLALRERVASPLRTLANLLEAMREGDYSIRARGARGEDALGDVIEQVNAIGATLRAQRLGAVEATALLRKVMEEIDVAVFTFNSDERLRLVNRAGERLMAQPTGRLLNRTAAELGLESFVRGEAVQLVQRSFPGASGRWGIHRSAFREGGLPHQMVVLSDLTRALREEELQAWQRLVRVLGHELNNSLAPIKSIAGSLESIVARDPRPEDWEEDLGRGLAVIAARADALGRFTGAYARLAKLPRPRLHPINVGTWVRHVAGLETRLRPELAPGPDLVVQGDSDQLEQLLINLLRNAVDASLETGGAVRMGWRRTPAHVEVFVEDEGPGLPNTANLFVPFFTTKPNGSGIGLVLSRQIAEAHGGALTLKNRDNGRGCEARLALPA